MLDLHSEFARFADEVRAAIHDVLESQQFINGPAVGELETALCRRYDVPFGVAVSSGTDALLCALMSLAIKPGDEVIVPAFTFFATAGGVARVGAKPVFVDIDRRTFNMDPAGVEAAMTDRTRAVIAVHLFGQCADMDAIRTVAEPRGVSVIEDAAQAIDARYHDRPAGALGDMACLSFYPTKNFGGFGEGGFILTRNEQLGKLSRQLRQHGESQRYVHERVGGNFRLDTMKAAILLVKLRYLDEFTTRRRQIAAQYDRLLADVPVTTPYVGPFNRHVYHQYSILCDRRDELATFLKERGVATGIYYPLPLHRQPCFADLGYKHGALPMAEETCRRVLSLPCHPMMADDDLAHVAAAIAEFYRQG